MGYDTGTSGAAGWLAMGLMMLLFWGLVAGLVVWAVRSLRPQHAGAPSRAASGTADEILAERYARGDIDEVEFERRRGLLHAAGR